MVRQTIVKAALSALAAVVFAASSGSVALAEDEAQVVTLSVNIGASEDYFVEHDGRFVPAHGSTAVVLVHQSGADMNSWGVLADALHENHIASLATNESRPGDVLAGVSFLRERGYSNIVLLGASIGGAAVLQTLAGRDAPEISKVILLASANGPDITDTEMPKLHIISSQDFYASAAYSVYRHSAEPKTILELDSREHAQALFRTEFKDEVVRAIVEFATVAE